MIGGQRRMIKADGCGINTDIEEAHSDASVEVVRQVPVTEAQLAV